MSVIKYIFNIQVIKEMKESYTQKKIKNNAEASDDSINVGESELLI